jgi:hypothetical protein
MRTSLIITTVTLSVCFGLHTVPVQAGVTINGITQNGPE